MPVTDHLLFVIGVFLIVSVDYWLHIIIVPLLLRVVLTVTEGTLEISRP